MYFITEQTLTIQEIKEELGFENDRKTRTWLKRNNISIEKVGGKPMVYKFLFDFKRQLDIVYRLKETYPFTWSEIYKLTTKDESMINAVFVIHPPLIEPTKRKAISNSQIYF